LGHHFALLPEERLRNVHDQCVKFRNSSAALVEWGVGHGGCLVLMCFLSNGNKTVWGFDSFEGMPACSAGRLAHYLDLHALNFAALSLLGVAPRNDRKIPKSSHIKDLQDKEAA